MTINNKPESNAQAWAWRIALGPAMILDGLLSTVSAGSLSLGASLAVARNLSRARMPKTA